MNHITVHNSTKLLYILELKEQLVIACFSFQCCFTSTKTISLLGTGEPKTATSKFTQLLSSYTNCDISADV